MRRTGAEPGIVTAAEPDSHRRSRHREGGVAVRDAGVAKLVDAPDLGSGAARCASSSLASRTIHQKALYGWGIAKR